MMVPSLESRLSAKIRRSTRYLVRHGHGWRLQMRSPADLDPFRNSTPSRMQARCHSDSRGAGEGPPPRGSVRAPGRLRPRAEE
jgi:hypothetical protein